jgi:molybdopterin synthase sulfur carrier subunit
MPSVRVRLFADIREEVGESEVEVEMESEGETVGDVIEELVARYPALEERLLSDGELRPYLNLTADGEPVEADETVDGVDEVAVFPPVSGGS